MKRESKRLIRRSKTLADTGNPKTISHKSPQCNFNRNIRKCIWRLVGSLSISSSVRTEKETFYLCSKLFKVLNTLQFTICECTRVKLNLLLVRILPVDLSLYSAVLNSHLMVKSSSRVLDDSNSLRPIKSNRALSTAYKNVLINSIIFSEHTKDVKYKKCKFHFRHA